MKKYGAMRFVAGVMQFVGWATVLFGIIGALAFVLSIFPDIPPHFRAISDRSWFTAFGIVLTGIFTIAAGQMVVAIADMATNSWHLREVAENSKKTVGFFEHIASPRATNAPTVQP
jgi:hypothetical protein